MRQLFCNIFFLFAVLIIITACKQDTYNPRMVFAMVADQEYQLEYVNLLAESVHKFGGKYSNVAIWVYTAIEEERLDSTLITNLENNSVKINKVSVPEEARWFFFASKVYAAAEAEKSAAGKYDILAWLNFDTILLKEPTEFVLPGNVSLGYRPVMHRNIGLGINDPLDDFWKRAFELMQVSEDTVFPMVTPADQDSIKPYINAGCLIVNPNKGILQNWVSNFEILYKDQTLRDMCEANIKKRIFIHQAALTGALLNYLKPDEYVELPETVNYPLFFNEMFGSKKDFHNITDVVTFRHEAFFNNPVEGWQDLLIGPKDKLDWLIEKLDKQKEKTIIE